MYFRAAARTTFLFATALALSLFLTPSLAAQQASPTEPSDPKPALQLDLAAIGYHQPSRMDRLTEYQPSVSLDYLDADHLLLTFNRKKLFKRQPDCPPTHEDRLMHAAVLELPSGRVVEETDWYLHDRRRYLWPLSPGKFLLRRGNNLYVIDANLHETLLLHSPKELLWVSVTPDGSQLILETENEPKAAPAAAKAPPKYVVKFLDAKTLATQRTLLFHNFTNLTGTSTGYTDVIRKGDVWLVRFGPSVAQRHNLARVRSRTVPLVLYPTENTMLIGRCATAACSYSVTTFTLSGHRLWRQHWPDLRSFPEVTRSQDNSRVAVSTLRIEPAPPRPPQFDDTLDDPFVTPVAERDVFRQEIQLFDTATGTSVLSLSVSPAVTTGQNISLSPDGQHLALLRGLSLELYDLPAISEDEQSKFAALQSDAPGLYSLGSNDPNSMTDDDAPSSDSTDPAELAADAPVLPAAEHTPDSHATGQPDAKADTSSASTQPGLDVANPSNPPANAAPEKTAPTASAPVPTIKVSTRAVVVDVVVSDSKGHPVRGLHQQDFELSEDNHSQTIRYFREYSDQQDQDADSSSANSAGKVASASTLIPASAPAAPTPNVFNNHIRSSQEGAVTLVLFDMLNTPPQDQVYARLQLIKFLQSKPKLSQFALCTLGAGANPLRMIQGFTTDETLLLAAAKGKKNQLREDFWQSSEQATRSSTTEVTQLALNEGRSSGFQNLANTLQEMQAEQQVTDTTERAGPTIDALMLLAQYLAGISGRKNVVWLSASFPVALSVGLLSTNPSIENPNFAYEIKVATNLLAESQVAIYPVDIRGLQTFGYGADSSGSGQSLPSIAPTYASPHAPPPPPQQAFDFSQLASEQDTLNQFAIATGGKAFLNTNGISEAIATANEQGSNYYSISYTSSNKVYDGKFRRIKVLLAQKGYTLAYRRGYFADEINAAAREASLARHAITTAMHYGSPLAHEVEFSVRVFPIGGKKKVDSASVGWFVLPGKKAAPAPPQVEVQRYVIDYTLAGSALRFVQQPNGGMRSALGLMFTSYGTEGRLLTAMSNRAVSDLQPDVYKTVAQGDVGLEQEIDIPVEAISLRVGLMDQMSNHLGTVDVPLPVPPDPTARRMAKVKPPLPEIEPD